MVEEFKEVEKSQNKSQRESGEESEIYENEGSQADDISLLNQISGAYKLDALCVHRDKHNTKGLWDKIDDHCLGELVSKYGTKKWKYIAAQMNNEYSIKGKTGKQCRERWKNHIDPEIKVDPFTVKEQDTIFYSQRRQGNKWAEIAKQLSGRSENSVKNFFYASMRKLIRRINKKLRTCSRKYTKVSAQSIMKLLEEVDLNINHASGYDTEELVEKLDPYLKWKGGQENVAQSERSKAQMAISIPLAHNSLNPTNEPLSSCNNILQKRNKRPPSGLHLEQLRNIKIGPPRDLLPPTLEHSLTKRMKEEEEVASEHYKIKEYNSFAEPPNREGYLGGGNGGQIKPISNMNNLSNIDNRNSLSTLTTPMTGGISSQLSYVGGILPSPFSQFGNFGSNTSSSFPSSAKSLFPYPFASPNPRPNYNYYAPPPVYTHTYIYIYIEISKLILRHKQTQEIV